ncbi:ABC transporter permease [Rathayibacter toxicus]|uniref:ABC transporter permease n=1 Tax=Rathayibacter toxicus TaxID=145458 RepID=UPI000CE8FCB2|nr:ABC transporter permease [Rathayibacter toxicus]PPI54303.1 ABC transporter permease [Rathayibacter toxicus]QOD10991.1 ABC transporter permease [Rathayibacter toxicus]QWL27736.1 ABC transporter permease [Rathayibacter toxicus]
MTTASTATVVGAIAQRSRRSVPAVLGVAPFAVYVLLFLAVPTALAVASGFQDAQGRFTFSNLQILGDSAVLSAFGASLSLSAITAVTGALLGAAICWALLGLNPRGVVRTAVDAAASVLAQFGGVMLAFAFIATIGAQGMITTFLAGVGISLYSDGVWLYQLPGLVLPYLYFQVPLMVLTFLPALEGLRSEWAEANAVLGGGAVNYWFRVAVPLLAPSFFGSVLLLFANALSSFATAAALMSQGTSIVPLQIRAALVSETVLGRENVAGALALGMLIVMVALMSGYALLQRRARRWQR